MMAFRVWLRPLGFSCRVQVDGLQNTRWLLGRLERAAVFKTCEPVNETLGSQHCTFQVPFDSHVTRGSLEKLLAKMPEVTLMTEPA